MKARFEQFCVFIFTYTIFGGLVLFTMMPSLMIFGFSFEQSAEITKWPATLIGVGAVFFAACRSVGYQVVSFFMRFTP